MGQEGPGDCRSWRPCVRVDQTDNSSIGSAFHASSRFRVFQQAANEVRRHFTLLFRWGLGVTLFRSWKELVAFGQLVGRKFILDRKLQFFD